MLERDGEGDGILFTTARKFKGLESDVVIVIDIDEKSFADNKAKCVFYVASSRAKHCLTYIADLTDDDMQQIVSDLGAEPGNNPQKALSETLNIQIEQID